MPRLLAMLAVLVGLLTLSLGPVATAGAATGDATTTTSTAPPPNGLTPQAQGGKQTSSDTGTVVIAGLVTLAFVVVGGVGLTVVRKRQEAADN